MIIDRDYVYVFGPEWADELLNFIERDPLAQGTMAQYELTPDDVRSYYLAQPHFDQIYHQLIENGDDFVHDPVETLLQAVKMTKDAAQQSQLPSQSNTREIPLHGHIRERFSSASKVRMFGQVRALKMPRAGGVRNSAAMILKLLMS